MPFTLVSTLEAGSPGRQWVGSSCSEGEYSSHVVVSGELRSMTERDRLLELVDWPPAVASPRGGLMA